MGRAKGQVQSPLGRAVSPFDIVMGTGRGPSARERARLVLEKERATADAVVAAAAHIEHLQTTINSLQPSKLAKTLARGYREHNRPWKQDMLQKGVYAFDCENGRDCIVIFPDCAPGLAPEFKKVLDKYEVERYVTVGYGRVTAEGYHKAPFVGQEPQYRSSEAVKAQAERNNSLLVRTYILDEDCGFKSLVSSESAINKQAALADAQELKEHYEQVNLPGYLENNYEYDIIAEYVAELQKTKSAYPLDCPLGLRSLS